ncbi:MAG: response regulator [Myxococcota bacterium]|jgi:response regulator RpfG family c-di-GMP phosphodiesterase|nr:response regulator [Myxococcota bacterium]
MLKERVLLVDDEPNVLSGYKRQLYKRFETDFAGSGAEALQKLSSSGEPFAVIISDMRMPGMDGVELLLKVKTASPKTTRMMLTGNADLTTAISAVNQGSIFRFLTKPCAGEDLALAIMAGIRQHRLVIAEEQLLRQTLQGSISVLTEILSLNDPEAFGKVSRIKELLKRACHALEIESSWELEAAVMLAPIGFVTLPHEVRSKAAAGRTMSNDEAQMLGEVPDIGHRLLSQIPRLESVAKFIQQSRMRLWENTPRSAFTADEELATEVKLLAILSDFVELEVEKKLSPVEAHAALTLRPGWYDKDLLEKLREPLVGTAGFTTALGAIVEVRAKDLVVDDLLLADVHTLDDRMLLATGTRLNHAFLERLNNYRRLVGIKEPIRVQRKPPSP